MVRSWLPLLSLLCLFGALPVLSTHIPVLPSPPRPFYEVTLDDYYVKRAFSFAVEQFNQDRKDFPNYLLASSIYRMWMVPGTDLLGRPIYHFRVHLVETTCTKTANVRMTYNDIQSCEEISENPKKVTCYLIVKRGFPLSVQYLDHNTCVPTDLP